jgi:hypothetical protein
MFLRNVGIYLQVYTASQPRTTSSVFYLFRRHLKVVLKLKSNYILANTRIRRIFLTGRRTAVYRRWIRYASTVPTSQPFAKRRCQFLRYKIIYTSRHTYIHTVWILVIPTTPWIRNRCTSQPEVKSSYSPHFADRFNWFQLITRFKTCESSPFVYLPFVSHLLVPSASLKRNPQICVPKGSIVIVLDWVSSCRRHDIGEFSCCTVSCL